MMDLLSSQIVLFCNEKFSCECDKGVLIDENLSVTNLVRKHGKCDVSDLLVIPVKTKSAGQFSDLDQVSMALSLSKRSQHGTFPVR